MSRIFKNHVSIYLFLCVFVFSTYAHASEKYNISATAIFQDEARFLPEWIEYHHGQGIEHFWLYNNNSQDEYKEALDTYIKSGLVELIEWPSIHQANDWAHFSFETQTGAYIDALNRSRSQTKWLAIIDTDEFLVPMNKKSLKKILKSNEHYAEVSIRWLMYGTSHEQEVPKGRMLYTLLYRARDENPQNDSYKSIVQPKKVQGCNHPHFCILNPGRKKIFLDRHVARINHYWTRDEKFLYDVKIKRYERWGADTLSIIEKASKLNEVFDPEILNCITY